MKQVTARTILAALFVLSPIAAIADGIPIPTVPSIPFPDFGATFTNSTFLAALGTFKADLQNLANQKIDARTSPGQWSAIKADIARINAIVAQQNALNAGRATQVVQQQQMQNDLDHVQQLSIIADSTLGRNEKLDVLSKMTEALLANQIKQRQLDLARTQAEAARQDALHQAYMGVSGTGVFRSP